MNSRFCVLGGRLGNIGMPEPKERMKADVLCNVHFLDDTSHSFKISRQDSGQVLLDLVFSHLGLLEREFFSLQYSEDAADSPRWLDPNKPIKKQLKGIFPTSLSFRVRFFITDPNSLQQEQTRHLYFLQIKNDIQEGRLSCPLSSAVVLASYAVQAELGDHSPSQHSAGYLSGSHFLPQQDSDFQAKVESLHVQHRGLKKSEAELCFLNTARTLELYGVEMHCCRDPSQSDLLVGIASGGVAIFQNMICCNFFSWVNIIKVSFKRKRFFIQLRQKHGESKDHTVAFIMPSYRACKNLWKSCVEHHTFFQVKRSLPPGNKLLLSNCSLSSNPARSLNSHIYRKVLGGMVWNPMIRRSNSAEHLETKSLPARSPPTTPNWRSPRLRHEVRKPRHSSVDNLASEMSYITESEDVFYTYRGNHTPSNLLNPQKQVSQRSEPGAPPSPSPQKRDSWEMSPDEAIDSDTQSYGQQNVAMDSDLLLVHITPDEEGKFGFNVKGGVDQKMPLVISHVSADSPAGQSNPQLLEGDQIVLINGRDISEHTHNQVVMFIRASRESHSKELALLVRRKGVSLRMEPQPDFESGFPSLGQTILLPGDCGESMLHCGGTLEESMLHCGGTLEESMAHLRKGLQSGVLLVQFEQLYRKKPGMSVSVAKLPQNMEKNRYKDILPYDCSRVVLEEEGDDYINASHIQMETGVRSGEAGAGPVKRYVASQGPLPHTCAHFWRAIWEQGARLIVMLTTLTERGRPKCHQYWPDPPEVREYGGLQVCCHSEECNLAYVFREFTLTNTKVGEQRSLAHLQYVAWPDHGVPEDPSDFLDFVRFVRNKRSEAEPLIVHCSAGIGRTGVLITMETAMELIEKKQPVNPLDIVRRLRDQRPMMVQTASQYRFVCEAILRVFQERQQSSSPPDACS